uniref:Bleomycin resistance protein n=2 Tax=Auxenochlorella protothecoides TaxID=3075 RepID=A0A1D1ZVV0_AUXPR
MSVLARLHPLTFCKPSLSIPHFRSRGLASSIAKFSRPAMLTPRILGAVPIVPVSSIKDSLTWYEKLGFVPRTDEDGDADNYALLTLGPVELHLRQVNSSEKLDAEANANGVYVRVEGLDALHDEFKGKGLSSLKGVQDTQWGMREFALSDPDGTLLRFGQIKTNS